MIRYENRIKMQEIRRLVEEHQYIQAVQVVDTLELTKIKSLTDLSVIADVLIQNERFDDALQVLSKVYAKTKTRRILYQLVDLSIRSKDVEEAEKYLLQYMKVAPQDSYRFIFRYNIDKLKNEPYEVLAESLEELKEYDYVEKWAYELAKLYHKSGKKDKCVRECSDIILWFGDGIYVEKAKLLKGYYVGEIDPIRMLKATEKKEAEKRLGLDKTKDYSSMKSEIDKFIAEEETEKREPEVTREETAKKEHEITREELEIVTRNETVEKESEIVRKERRAKKEPETSDVPELKETYVMEEAQEAENAINPDLKDKTGISPDTIAEDSSMEDETEALADERLDSIFSRTNLDYHKLFGCFIHNPYCRSEIADFFDNMFSENTKQTHLTIRGNRKSGKTTLAKEIAKALYGFGRINSSRIAKISASRINHMNLEDNFDKLMDCTLLIEEGGSLNSSGIKQLLHLMRHLEGHIFVILEDTREGINKLLNSNDNMKSRFRYGITLPGFTEEYLFHYANHYIKVNDYQLSNDAKALLKNMIQEILNSENAEDGLEIIMKVVKEAKVQADKRNKEKLLRIIGSQKLSETDFLYINLEDFESIYGEE